ncbi:winged helix-turn-helix domain-containing protein [Planobispora longispora]|uniref:OmpR/PhoB-type domain-containing protein n=1 Tax=Planobispora longispora TaxID=28887 RepID=A0A8J3W484_9ACTN|nr:winged helix-turn-helix domain-containing protein [Planobispora longispora]GIH76159.1 hypothetical protein Plo01_25880 [Planobispora longispora]
MAELIRIDTEAYQVWKGDQEIRLSLTRFHLLATLIANAGCVVSRRQLYLAVWGHDWGTLSKTLHMHLVWLRRALGDDARQPTYITTVSGVGWRFEASMVAPSPEVSHDAVQAAAVAILNASCLCKDDRDDLRFTVEAHGGCFHCEAHTALAAALPALTARSIRAERTRAIRLIHEVLVPPADDPPPDVAELIRRIEGGRP